MTTNISKSFKVEVASIEDLVPFDRNARTHSAEQVEQIAGSIRQFGWTQPILAEVNGSGIIVAGHGRRLAAMLLYEQGETIKLPNGKTLPKGMVPVIDCSGWSEQQRRAYTLADNQIALNAGWDEALLKLELTDLRLDGVELGDLGFSAAGLLDLFPPPPEAPDQFPRFDESVPTDHVCPKCNYRWSGKAS